MSQQEKKWSSNFVLDGAKLTRLHEEVAHRLHRAGAATRFQFVANTQKNVLSTLPDIAAVLRLDNTRKDPLTALSIEGVSETQGVPQLSVVVEFANRTAEKPKDNVRLSVSGLDPTLVSELFAAASEQIERALITPWSQLVALCSFLIIFVLTIALVLNPRVPSRSLLTEEDVNQLSQMAATAHDAQTRVDFLFEVKRREIETLARMYRPLEITGHTAASLLVLVGIILVSCLLLLYLAVFCYPRAVFAWGDYGEHYAGLVARRKAIWKFLIVSLVGGVLISLFGASVQQWLQIGRR